MQINSVWDEIFRVLTHCQGFRKPACFCFEEGGNRFLRKRCHIAGDNNLHCHPRENIKCEL